MARSQASLLTLATVLGFVDLSLMSFQFLLMAFSPVSPVHLFC